MKRKVSFKELCRLVLVLLGMVIFAFPVYGQETMVRGQVFDQQTEEKLPGVNVMVKGTTVGTSTDSEGNYELDAPSLQDTLIFTFVGYQTLEVPINGRTTVDIELQSEAIAGEEVVVVGYGTQQKTDVTGSIAEMDDRTVSERPLDRIDQPLYVIDGFSLEVSSQNSSGDFSGGNPMNNINPGDIESIQVLKDASAASIYGLRASNGVVIINTKQGSQGDMTINYSSSAGW